MFFNENYSVIRGFLSEAGLDEENWTMSRWSNLFDLSSDKPTFKWLSEDFNELTDTGFYSDRFASWCSKEVKEAIKKVVAYGVYSMSCWQDKETAEKVIKCYCLANGMMKENDVINVTALVRLVNKSDGSDYYYITYRVVKN